MFKKVELARPLEALYREKTQLRRKFQPRDEETDKFTPFVPNGTDGENTGKVVTQVALLIGVSERTYYRAKVIRDYGTVFSSVFSLPFSKASLRKGLTGDIFAFLLHEVVER